MSQSRRYAIVGAGPSGLAAARALSKRDIDWLGFELHGDVGGLWDIDNPRSTVYDSAHLISSKTRTEFTEYPMTADVPDYPSHRELKRYFHGFAERFGLKARYRFNAEVTGIERGDAGWRLSWRQDGCQHDEPFAGVILANGTLSEPNRPEIGGEFGGRVMHSSEYRSPRLFAGKRVLIVGAGNSGCDIAVDAVHHASSVTMSVRRGYHFVPKYIMGRPADTVGGMVRLPARLKQWLDSRVLRLFTGNPERFGFPRPDHRLYESHPIVNSLVLHYVGHGDIAVSGDIERFDGDDVVYRDGSRAGFDIVVLATGYKLHYPFIDRRHLNWHGAAPRLFLNAFHPDYDDLFVVGMVEAAGIGWQGRMEQAELVAAFIDARQRGTPAAATFRERKREPFADLSGGYRYLTLDRMAYYVHNDTFRSAVRAELASFA